MSFKRDTTFTGSPIFVAASLGMGIFLFGYLIYMLYAGAPIGPTIIAISFVLVLLFLFGLMVLSPDTLTSVYTERALLVASATLEKMRDGLTISSAEKVCKLLLPMTKASCVAITNEEDVLACLGAYANDFPVGSAIHTPATHYVLEHGRVRTFTTTMNTQGAQGSVSIPAGIVAPLKVRDKSVGTLKFYFRSSRQLNQTQYALAMGFAELLSTQLALHELEEQTKLATRAEIKALQAQINPHFLFNTLNTIKAFTRTDPKRAHDLLGEFSSFFRATLENSGTLISLEREVQQTQRYLMFEKARFGDDRIAETCFIQPGLEDVEVPAFIIQPLAENAVRHAMRDEGRLHIDVTIARDGKTGVIIEVSDDGVGMPEDVAQTLFDENAAHHGEGTGVALHNIAKRIKLFYGPKSYIHVISNIGVGTTILMRLDQSEAADCAI